MKKTLPNLIIFGDFEQNTMFFFRNQSKVYRYVSYSLHNLSDGGKKALVIAFNLNSMKYEVLDVSIGAKLHDKEIVIL